MPIEYGRKLPYNDGRSFRGQAPLGELFVVPGRSNSFGSLMGLLAWEILWMPGDMGIDEEDE
ncbi:hypothetical protein BBD41_09995 [Paenibacillus ihbetae]|uniref:Uncharacterized protein n=1 Tax=Paenibacillus ihbetae TaxID=1870820 RepID=A0A1B2DYW8_9BACL|nr:hypothetical protein BBD41_09995 [Paenibacillus ihbetae]